MLEIERDYSVNRKGSGSYKWDGMIGKFGNPDLIPLWVADMDFRAPKEIVNAIKSHLDYGVFGYALPPQGYFDAVIAWEKEHHGYKIEKEWMRYTPGVVPGIFWCISALTQPADRCLVLTPCYYPFLDAVKNNNRELVCLDLVADDNGRYTVDLKEFEKAITDNDIKIFLLCSPHNPVGRVWSREELTGMLDLCKKNHVYVVSDEIHQDIVMKGYKHIPAAISGEPGAYDDILITLGAPSKTFNLAGMQNAFAIISNAELKAKVEKYIQTSRINKGTTIGYIAAQAAYEHGNEWLASVLDVIEDNFVYMRDALNRELPLATVTPLEGTYLMWIDLSAYLTAENLEQVVQDEAGLAVDYGKWFWNENKTDLHIRVNLATSKENIHQATEQLIASIKNHI